MPRFYCDYCDAYLTHDSMSGRKQHMRGWKHKENFKNFYLNAFAQERQKMEMLEHQKQMMQQQQFMQQQQEQMQFGAAGGPGAPMCMPVPPLPFQQPPAMMANAPASAPSIDGVGAPPVFTRPPVFTAPPPMPAAPPSAPSTSGAAE
mmetsp:Transcript_32612/g.54977  ORF Transcript_32612/g.54977 Transcript_32612/m.54977 type:complete len:147 (+) Transcript_32612:67-507(+)